MRGGDRRGLGHPAREPFQLRIFSVDAGGGGLGERAQSSRCRGSGRASPRRPAGCPRAPGTSPSAPARSSNSRTPGRLRVVGIAPITSMLFPGTKLRITPGATTSLAKMHHPADDARSRDRLLQPAPRIERKLDGLERTTMECRSARTPPPCRTRGAARPPPRSSRAFALSVTNTASCNPYVGGAHEARR